MVFNKLEELNSVDGRSFIDNEPEERYYNVDLPSDTIIGLDWRPPSGDPSPRRGSFLGSWREFLVPAAACHFSIKGLGGFAFPH